MKYIRQTIIAGATAIRTIYSSTGERKPGLQRRARANMSPEKVQAVNLRNAIKKLTAILNHNFEDGDYHVTLTYRTEPTKEQAKNKLRKFKSNMRKHHSLPEYGRSYPLPIVVYHVPPYSKFCWNWRY